MKSAAVEVESVDPTMSMHTKQLADHWGVDSRSLTNWIARVRKCGYKIGQPGERNRTYFNDADQDLIKAARYGTLTKNPNSEKCSEPSENVLSMEERLRQQQQEATQEATQNRNLELRASIVQGNGSLLATRTEAAYQEGSELAKAELGAKLRGYLETRQQTDVLFNQLVGELDGVVVVEEVKPELEAIDPKQLVAAVF